MVALGDCRAYYKWVWQQLELLDHKPLRVHNSGKSQGHIWQLTAQLAGERCVPWVPLWLQSPMHRLVDTFLCFDHSFLKIKESRLLARLPLPSRWVLLWKCFLLPHTPHPCLSPSSHPLLTSYQSISIQRRLPDFSC